MLFIQRKYDQRFFFLPSFSDRGSVMKVSQPSELPQPCLLSEIDLFPVSKILVPVVQRADNSIQWINRYPADKMYSNQYICSAG